MYIKLWNLLEIITHKNDEIKQAEDVFSKTGGAVHVIVFFSAEQSVAAATLLSCKQRNRNVNDLYRYFTLL